MKEIYIFNNGGTTLARIERLFDTHGPYTLEGRRLDLLTKVQLLVDSSTVTTTQSGTNTSKASTGSMVGRAVVGGVLTGGAGAVIGGVTGKRETTINTKSIETLNTELTAELFFQDGSSLYVLLKDKNAFHWLLGFANQPPLTESDLKIEEDKAIHTKFINQIKSAREKAISTVTYQKYGNYEATQKAQDKILNSTYENLKSNPNFSSDLEYSDFLSIYNNIVEEVNIKKNKQVNNWKNTFFSLLSWVFGILFLIFGLLDKNIASFIISLLLIPPLRRYTYSITGIIIPITYRMLLIFFIILFFSFSSYKTEIPLENKQAVTPNPDVNINAVPAKVKLYETARQPNQSIIIKTTSPTNQEQLNEVDASINPKLKQTVTIDSFNLFQVEAETAKDELDCPNSISADITPASYDGDGDLYGCILGNASTVKWFINQAPKSSRVSSVKYIWNDWFKEMGYGVHADKREAQRGLNTIIKLYAQEKAKELQKVFYGKQSKTISTSKFILNYTYKRGPAIDERMIVVTENLSSQKAPIAKTKLLSN